MMTAGELNYVWAGWMNGHLLKLMLIRRLGHWCNNPRLLLFVELVVVVLVDWVGLWLLDAVAAEEQVVVVGC